jgi:hypothetical protein
MYLDVSHQVGSFNQLEYAFNLKKFLLCRFLIVQLHNPRGAHLQASLFSLPSWHDVRDAQAPVRLLYTHAHAARLLLPRLLRRATVARALWRFILR